MGGSSTQIVQETKRHAPYVESLHQAFLESMGGYATEAMAVSPYASYSMSPIDTAFLSAGYLLSSFPSLFDMFGKHLAGVDVDSIWKKAVESVLNVEEVQERIEEQREVLEDKIEKETLPAFQLGMRDANAVATSSFVVGKSVIEKAKVLDMGALCTEAVKGVLETVNKQYTDVMNWNKQTVETYAKILQRYYEDKIKLEEFSYNMFSMDRLWPLRVLSYEGPALGAFDPKTAMSRRIEIRTTKSKAIQVMTIAMWTAQGAYIGSAYPPYGTAIGAVVGFLIGLADVFILQA